MPLYQIDLATHTLSPVRPVGLAQAPLREQDLEGLLRERFEVLDGDVLIFAEQFSNWEGSSRRIDLLGLDREGNLVVVELKCEPDGGHMELQAIRYAAMVSAMNFADVVNAYEGFLKKRGQDPAQAQSRLFAFLGSPPGQEPTITDKPRIVLMSPRLHTEISTTVLWLREQGIDIRCFEYDLYRVAGSLFVDLEQVIPMPSAADYQVRIRQKNEQRREQATAVARGEDVLSRLAVSGVLEPGCRLRLYKPPRAGLSVPDGPAQSAIFHSPAGQGIEWELDHGRYTLSGLTKRICEQFGGDVGAGAFRGPDHWALDQDTVNLTTLANQLSTQALGEAAGIEGNGSPE